MQDSSSMAKNNKMGAMPINKLLISMALPMMVSMLVQALYNVVDSIFVGMINEDALTAVSLAFPVQGLLIAFGTGMGVGVNALLSRSLGEKNQEMANKAAVNGIFLSWINAAIFLIFGLFFAGTFFRSQTDNPEIVKYGTQYLSVICIFSIGPFTQLINERLLQSTGRTVLSMISQGIGAIINLIFDPILIFGLIGFPKMGVTGAAVATVAGQIISGIVSIIFNFKYNKDIHISFRAFRPSIHIIGRIYSVGLPSILIQAIASVLTYCMNLILIEFSSTATAVLGVYFKLQSFFFMPLFGMNNAMVPIIAYNYGAKNKGRITQVMKLSVIYASCMMFLGLIIFQIFPGQLLSMFNASEQMLDIGRYALRIMSLSYVFAGFSIITSSIFQALGNGLYSLIVSICRQLVILLPAAYILSKIGGLNAVWWAYPFAEIFSMTLCVILLIRINKNVLSKIPN